MKRSAVAAALTATLLTGCGGTTVTTTTTSAPASSTTTTTTVPATTTTVAATSTTATTSTTVVTTLDIVGDEAFTTQTESALQLLAGDAAVGYAQVIAYIVTIESVVAGSGMDVFTKTYLVGDETAFAPGFNDDDQVVWLAGTIVHDSCHSRLYSEGEEYIGRDAELACMVDQLAALESIDNDFFENYVQGLIDGVDDPENAYWNDPNRHW